MIAAVIGALTALDTAVWSYIWRAVSQRRERAEMAEVEAWLSQINRKPTRV